MTSKEYVEGFNSGWQSCEEIILDFLRDRGLAHEADIISIGHHMACYECDMAELGPRMEREFGPRLVK